MLLRWRSRLRWGNEPTGPNESARATGSTGTTNARKAFNARRDRDEALRSSLQVDTNRDAMYGVSTS